MASTASFSSKKELIQAEGEVVGEFNDYTWGDYPHIHIIVNMKKKSYFCEYGPCWVFEDHEESLKGVKIKISWEKVKRVIPQDNMNVSTIFRTKNICSFSKISFKSRVGEEEIKVCNTQKL